MYIAYRHRPSSARSFVRTELGRLQKQVQLVPYRNECSRLNENSNPSTIGAYPAVWGCFSIWFFICLRIPSIWMISSSDFQLVRISWCRNHSLFWKSFEYPVLLEICESLNDDIECVSEVLSEPSPESPLIWPHPWFQLASIRDWATCWAWFPKFWSE